MAVRREAEAVLEADDLLLQSDDPAIRLVEKEYQQLIQRPAVAEKISVIPLPHFPFSGVSISGQPANIHPGIENRLIHPTRIILKACSANL
jgi:hypothetical protein